MSSHHPEGAACERASGEEYTDNFSGRAVMLFKLSFFFMSVYFGYILDYILKLKTLEALVFAFAKEEWFSNLRDLVALLGSP